MVTSGRSSPAAQFSEEPAGLHATRAGRQPHPRFPPPASRRRAARGTLTSRLALVPPPARCKQKNRK